MLFPSPSFPFHYPLVQLPDVHIKAISFIPDVLYRCDHVHTLCIRLISLSHFEDTCDSRRRFPNRFTGSCEGGATGHDRAPALTGNFDKRLTVLVSPLSSCFAYSSAAVPFPSSLGWFLFSLPFTRNERSRQRWPVPLSDFVILFLVRFSLSVDQSTWNLSSPTPTPPGLFIICNTVLCSVAVWNLSLVQSRPFYNGSWRSILLESLAHVQSLTIDYHAISSLSADHLNAHNVQHKFLST